MAKGDMASSWESVANGAYIDIQPAGTEEWAIHNIKVPATADVELYATDGVDEEKIDSETGGWLDFVFHVKNGEYLRVKNVSGATVYLGYDGIVTHA